MDQLEGYKSLVKETFARLTDKKIPWKGINDTCKKAPPAVGLFRVECLLTCNPRRLFALLADHHYVTRSKWDASLREMSVVESYPHLEDGSLCVMTRNYPAFLGIQWLREPSIIIYHSIPAHGKLKYDGPPILEGIWIKPVDEHKVFLTIIGNQANLEHLKPHQIYEPLARNDSLRYLQVYTPWKCDICRRSVPAHELECRQDGTARHWRCADMKCYEAQMEGRTKCEFCGLEREK